MKGTKWWFQSRAVWGTIIAAAALALQAFGVELSEGEAQQLVDAAVAVGGAAGIILAIWGRAAAKKRLRFNPKAMPVLLVIAAGLSALGGCSALQPAFSLVGLQQQVDFVEGKGLEGVAQAIDVYCSTESIFIPQRQDRLAQINSLTSVGNMTALDCNEDGSPDF